MENAMLKEIKVTTNEHVIEGTRASFADLDKIARLNCRGLTYLMNITDIHSSIIYMWFKDDTVDKSYFVDVG